MKKLLALIMAAAMVLALVPMTAMAAAAVSTETELRTEISSQDVQLNSDIELAAPLVAPGKRIDLNGKELKGDVIATLKINGGYYITGADAVKMVAPVTDSSANGVYTYLASQDAVITSAQGAVSIDAGTVTLGINGRTLPQQKVTVGKDATFIIPAGKTFEILGTAVVEGEIEAKGTIILGKSYEYNNQPVDTTGATLTAKEGLNVVSGLDGYDVVFANGIYRLEVSSVVTEPAPIPETGDGMGVFVFAGLALISMLGMAVMKKREF